MKEVLLACFGVRRGGPQIKLAQQELKRSLQNGINTRSDLFSHERINQTPPLFFLRDTKTKKTRSINNAGNSLLNAPSSRLVPLKTYLKSPGKQSTRHVYCTIHPFLKKTSIMDSQKKGKTQITLEEKLRPLNSRVAGGSGSSYISD